jgi:putative zinc ribbon protein
MSNKRKKSQLQTKRQQKTIDESGRVRGQRAREREEMIAAGKIIFADLSKQAPNNSYGPPTEYRDHEFTCCDCGTVETWTAKQQQWWYEVAKGDINSRATRCQECRAKRRKYKGLAPKTIAEREAREREQDQS